MDFEKYKQKLYKSEKEIKINSKILKENGCVEPLKGKKSKCVLKIVPENDKCDTFQINVNWN